MSIDRFELVGNDPALNFVNTIHDWTEREKRDYLESFDEALAFGEAAGILSRAERMRLARGGADGELERLRKLRARLERILRAAVSGRRPGAADLDALAREAARAAAAAKLRAERGAFVRSIDDAGSAVLRLRIAEASVVLLTSGSLQRVKACPACGWFFVDATRNRSRRWCSMRTCGSIAKARRYYQRRKRRAAR